MANHDPRFLEDDDFQSPQVYESYFQPEASASPVAAQLNRTAEYAGPPPATFSPPSGGMYSRPPDPSIGAYQQYNLPPAPAYRSAPEMSPWELVAMGLAGGAAGFNGQPNPTAGLLKGRQEGADRENEFGQRDFENRLRLGTAGIAQAGERREAAEFSQKQTARQKHEAAIGRVQGLLENRPMRDVEIAPAGIDPTTGAAIPARTESQLDMQALENALAREYLNIDPTGNSTRDILRGEGLNARQLKALDPSLTMEQARTLGQLNGKKQLEHMDEMLKREKARQVEGTKLGQTVADVLQSHGVNPRTATPQQIAAARSQLQTEHLRAQREGRQPREPRQPTKFDAITSELSERQRTGKPFVSRQFEAFDSPRLNELLKETDPLSGLDEPATKERSPVAQPGEGRIKVLDLATGQRGSILKGEFDPKKYSLVK